MVFSLLSINLFLIGLILLALWIRKVGHPESRVWLSLCLVIFFISILEALFLFTDKYLEFPRAGFWAAPMVLALGPSLYLFIRSILNPSFHYGIRIIKHFLPYILVTFFLQWHYQQLTAREQIEIIQASLSGQNPPAFVFISMFGFFLWMGLYLWFSFSTVQVYRHKLKSVMANLESVKTAWLKQIGWCFLLILVFSFTQNLFRLYAPALWQWAILANLLLFVVLGSLLLFRVMDDFPQIHNLEKTQPNPALKEIAEKANLTMEKEALYLQEDINLYGLAKHLKVKPHALSQALNEIEKKHFFDYINNYRVRHAANLLNIYSPKEKNITEVMYASGFNSKSSFNSAFKMHLGSTPSDFRKKSQ